MGREKKKIEIAVKFKSVFKNIKRLFLLWLVLAIVVGILASVKVYVSSSSNGSVSALVNFSFDGIEEGLDPSGNKFDIYEMKNSDNIKSALEKSGLDSSDENILEIKNNISIDGTVPDNIIDEITHYDSIVGSDGINSYTTIKDTSYNPTQFVINFKYRNAGLSKKEGADLINNVVDEYKTYFYNTYGYNKSIEESLLSIDYEDYDYSEAVDIIDSSLNSMKVYVDSLAKNDNTRFVSSQTGYSFSDISDAIDTLRSENVGWISSYIVSNNITKNKNDLINYYQFKIDDLTRVKQSYQEQLNNVTDAITKYKKTNTVVLGVGNDSQEYNYSQPSDEYDELVKKKVTYQTNISNSDEKIKLYKERMERLKTSNNPKVNEEQMDSYFDDIDNRINNLVADLKTTATEYYEDVALYNAYQIVTYAKSSALSSLKVLLSSSKEIIAYQLILLSMFILASLILSILEMNGVNVKVNRKVKVQSK